MMRSLRLPTSRAFKLDHLRLGKAMTHFAAADDLAQNEFTGFRTRRFHDAVAAFREKGFNPSYLDLANSPGAVATPPRGNMVRLGGVLYGLGGDVLPAGIEKPELRPVMTPYTKIAHLKKVPAGETIGYGRTFSTQTDSLIATIPIGYQDGYSRSLSNKGRAIVRGKHVPVAGRISMDWTTLDVTGVDGVEIGDEVVLIGKQGDVQNLQRHAWLAKITSSMKSRAASTAECRAFIIRRKTNVMRKMNYLIDFSFKS